MRSRRGAQVPYRNPAGYLPSRTRVHAAGSAEPAYYVRRRKDASLTLYGPCLPALITAAVSRELESATPGTPVSLAR